MLQRLSPRLSPRLFPRLLLAVLASFGPAYAQRQDAVAPAGRAVVMFEGIAWRVVGGGASSLASARVAPLTPGYHHLAVLVPSQGVYELLLAYVPALAPGGQAPLLVGYHGFGVSPLDLTVNTEFDEQCEQRGWFLLAPFSIVPVGQASNHFSSIPAQHSTAAALRWFLSEQPVDGDRVYGVGFSLGAGLAASFAARFQGGAHDPLVAGDPLFAALALHTGTFDIADVWWKEPGSRAQLELLYGGTPLERPVEYARCSTVQVGAGPGGLASAGIHMARNLSHIPVQLWYAPADPLGYLVSQAGALHTALLANPGAAVSAHPIAGVRTHSWSTLDAQVVCDWLAQQVCSVPLARDVLADRDARYLHLRLERDPGEPFAELSYEVDPAGHAFALTGTLGLARVETRLADWGVQPSLPMTITLEALDAGDTLVLRGLQQAPLSVRRDGQVQASGWSWDWTSGSLWIEESQAGLHVWQVLP